MSLPILCSETSHGHSKDIIVITEDQVARMIANPRTNRENKSQLKAWQRLQQDPELKEEVEDGDLRVLPTQVEGPLIDRGLQDLVHVFGPGVVRGRVQDVELRREPQRQPTAEELAEMEGRDKEEPLVPVVSETPSLDRFLLQGDSRVTEVVRLLYNTRRAWPKRFEPADIQVPDGDRLTTEALIQPRNWYEEWGLEVPDQSQRRFFRITMIRTTMCLFSQC